MIADRSMAGDTAALMLGEALHRFSNNLQIIVSMTNEILRGDVRDAHVREGLFSLQDRVSLLAAISRTLSGPFGPEMATGLAIERLCSGLATCFDRHSTTVRVIVDGEINRPEECRVVLLLVAELMTNALKHGCDKGALSVSVNLSAGESGSRLTFCSNTPPRDRSDRPRIATELAEAAGGCLVARGTEAAFDVEAWLPRRSY